MRLVATALAVLTLGSAAAMAADRRVDIVNQTGQTMVHFYASNECPKEYPLW